MHTRLSKSINILIPSPIEVVQWIAKLAPGLDHCPTVIGAVGWDAVVGTPIQSDKPSGIGVTAIWQECEC